MRSRGKMRASTSVISDPIAAGSVTDVIMRAAANELQSQLGQPLVIENRGGAAGILTVGRAAECGAMWASFSPIRLPGSVADVFLTRLRQELPDAADRVEARTRALRGGLLNNPVLGQRMEGHGAYWESIQRLFETVATRVGLDGGQSWRRCVAEPTGEGPKQLTLF